MFPHVQTGDFISFVPTGNHVVPPIVAPVPMIGTGIVYGPPLSICVLGDELPPYLRVPLPYAAPPFVIPGVGTLVLVPPPLCLSKTHFITGRPVLLMGPPFPCQFVVQSPARAGPIPDPVPVKNFMCQYISKTTWHISL